MKLTKDIHDTLFGDAKSLFEQDNDSFERGTLRNHYTSPNRLEIQKKNKGSLTSSASLCNVPRK
jgi:hypothetical protein